MSNPGKLDRRVVIQKRTVTKDGTGSRIITWADDASVWAQLVNGRGSEAMVTDADRGQETRQFRIRYRGINATDHRIFYQLRFWDITGLSEEGRRDMMLVDTIATLATQAAR